MVCKIEAMIERPSGSQLEHIRREINEDADRLSHFENLLHAWIESQPHFPKKYEARVVRNFLRNCKYNMDKAKAKLEYHFVAKHLHPNMFADRSPSSEEIVRAMNVVSLVPLPMLSERGCRVFFSKIEDGDASNFEIQAIFKLFFMLYDLILMGKHPVGGEILIVDGSYVGASHCVKFANPLMRTIIALMKEAYAIRLKEIHVVNMSPMLENIFAVIKPFLHPKVRNAFVSHPTNESLCERFGKENIPSNYGGTCKTLRELMSDWQEVLNEHTDWFIEQESVKITDVIPEKVESAFYFRDQLGVDGSFRKLNID